MSVTETRGVVTLARILAQVATGEALGASAIAHTHSLSRSSVFNIVRELERAGFVLRRDDGTLVPGPAATALAWATYGLADLVEPAGAIMRWLYASIEGEVRLSAGSTTLLVLAGPARSPTDGEDLKITRRAGERSGPAEVQVSITLSASLEEVARADAVANLDRAVAALEGHLANRP